MYVGMGQARVAQAVNPDEFFEQRTAPNGTRYKAARPHMTTYLKGAMVGWQVRQSSTDGRSDLATLTPYNESTGPRDPGDGFRWIEERWLLGRGIIMIPPAEWVPGGGTDLMRMTTGTTKLIATESLGELDEHAAIGKDGFVLYDPKVGWTVAGTKPIGKASLWPYAVLFAAAAIGGGALLGLRRRR